MTTNCRIDWDHAEIIVGSERRELAPIEAAILWRLTRTPGKYVSTPKLIHAIWGQKLDGGPDRPADNVRVWVSHLRRKSPWTILGRRFYGYSIEGYDGLPAPPLCNCLV